VVARKTYFPQLFQGELIRNFLPHFVIYSKLRARHCPSWLVRLLPGLCESLEPGRTCEPLRHSCWAGKPLSHSFTDLPRGKTPCPQPSRWLRCPLQTKHTTTTLMEGKKTARKHDNAHICLLLVGKMIVIHGMNRELAWMGEQHHKTSRLLHKIMT